MRKRLLFLIPIAIVSTGIGYGGAYAAHHTFLKPVRGNETDILKATSSSAASIKSSIREEKVGPCESDVTCKPVVIAALPLLQQMIDSIDGAKIGTSGIFRIDKKNDKTHTVTGSAIQEQVESTTLPDGSIKYDIAPSFETTVISQLQQKAWFKDIVSTPDGLGVEFDEGADTISRYGARTYFSTTLVKRIA